VFNGGIVRAFATKVKDYGLDGVYQFGEIPLLRFSRCYGIGVAAGAGFGLVRCLDSQRAGDLT